MPSDEENTVDFAKLHRINIVAIVLGSLVFCLSIYLSGQLTNPQLGWIVLSVALGAIAYSGTFYFACLATVPDLQTYLREDKTVIRGETVEMVTETEASGDERLDEWVSRYVFARNLFGLAIIPLLLLGGVLVFG